MRWIRPLAILAIATVIMSSDFFVANAWGQQNERLFGNGRFMRRIRNDIFGVKPKKPERPGSSKDAKSATGKSKSSRSAKLGSGKAPTLAPPRNAPTRPGLNANQPSPNKSALSRYGTPSRQPSPIRNQKPTLTRPPARLNAGTDNSYTPRLPKQIDLANASRSNASGQTRSGARVPASVTRSSPTATLGFGMLVEARGERLVITQLDPQGNAKQAGVKVGDVIIQGAGVDFTSMEDFNQVAEVFKDGDQLEFELSRRGKEEKLLLVFGEPADDSDAAIPLAPGDIKPESRETKSALSGPLRVNEKDNFSFLPTEAATNRRNDSPSNRNQAIGSGTRGNNQFQVPARTPDTGNLKSVLGRPGPAGANQFERQASQPARSSNQRTNQWKSLREINQGANSEAALQRKLAQQQAEIELLRRQLQQAGQPQVQSESIEGPELSGPGG